MAQSGRTGKFPSSNALASAEVSMEILRKVCRTCVVLSALLLASVAAYGQNRGTPLPPDASTGGMPGPRNPLLIPMPSINMGNLPDDSPQVRARRENLRKVQRKERMVSSANRLLELTKRFQADLATHPDLTPENAKQLDEISKLAREVKSRMQE
jgi:hypothetical protein